MYFQKLEIKFKENKKITLKPVKHLRKAVGFGFDHVQNLPGPDLDPI